MKLGLELELGLERVGVWVGIKVEESLGLEMEFRLEELGLELWLGRVWVWFGIRVGAGVGIAIKVRES